MSLQNLTKQLKNEATANPVKAGVLGIGCVLALWFWFPLITKMIGSDKKSSPVAVAPQTAAAAPTPMFLQPPQPVSAASVTRNDWSKLATWIEQDSHTTSANREVGGRNPFQSATVETKIETETTQQAPRIVEITPEALGLKLTSTLVGSRRSVALINGKAYVLKKQPGTNQNKPTTIKIDSNQQTYQVQLVDVQAQSALVKISGKPYRLKIEKPELASRFQFRQGEE